MRINDYSSFFWIFLSNPKLLWKMPCVGQVRVEPPNFGFGVRCSTIQPWNLLVFSDAFGHWKYMSGTLKFSYTSLDGRLHCLFLFGYTRWQQCSRLGPFTLIWASIYRCMRIQRSDVQALVSPLNAFLHEGG